MKKELKLLQEFYTVLPNSSESPLKEVNGFAAEGYYDFNVYLQEYPFRYELVPSADE